MVGEKCDLVKTQWVNLINRQVAILEALVPVLRFGVCDSKVADRATNGCCRRDNIKLAIKVEICLVLFLLGRRRSHRCQFACAGRAERGAGRWLSGGGPAAAATRPADVGTFAGWIAATRKA